MFNILKKALIFSGAKKSTFFEITAVVVIVVFAIAIVVVGISIVDIVLVASSLGMPVAQCNVPPIDSCPQIAQIP